MSKVASGVKFLLYIGMLSVSLFMTAQTSLIDGLYEMQQNPRLKEKVYVHTNKTAYFSDDIIWFKAYVGDSINHPSVRTKILEVKLFDENGTQMFAKNIAITEGTGLGQIELNDAIAPGVYYLQARTNYMRNFGKEYQYLQEITILGQLPPNPSMEGHEQYDVQLLPESGNLIEDVENSLGIKALLGGRSVDFQGTIINNEGEAITTFQSEYEGLGKCSFIYKKGETYRAKIQLQDTLLEQDVPKALAKGVSLSIDNSDEKYLKISVKTNEATLKNQAVSNYTLLYYQDRQLFQLLSMERLDSTNLFIETDKNIFLDGVHTLTLFADDQPIAERKFYMETGRKKSFVSLEKAKIDSDSITYRLSTKGKKKRLGVDLSVSILQKKSKVVDQKNTIESAFLLSPYVKGTIENPAYYFDTENEKRKEHLDLLLLTQGWTRYTLDELIQEINPDEAYEFEQGFELKGTLKKEGKYTDLVLIPDDLRIIDKVELTDQSQFVFQNLDLFKGDTLRVAYRDSFGKLIKPSTIAYDTTANKTTTDLKIDRAPAVSAREKGPPYGFDNIKNYGTRVWGNDSLFRNLERTIDLDEVTVTDKKRSERYLQRRKTIAKYKPLVSDIGKYYDIPFPEVFKNSDMGLMDLLAQQGFTVRTRDNGEAYLGGHRKFAPLFINGRSIRPEELPTLQLPLNDIENIMVNNLGFDPGAQVSIMIFQVFTSADYRQYKNKPFDQFVVNNGFDRARTYYTPRYIFEESRPLDLLEVDWKPHLKTDTKGDISFKIAKNEKTDGYLFVIQGFSNDGHLISKTIATD